MLGRGADCEQLCEKGSAALRYAAGSVLPRKSKGRVGWSALMRRLAEQRAEAIDAGKVFSVRERTPELRKAGAADRSAFCESRAAEMEGCKRRGDARGLFRCVASFAERALRLPLRVKGRSGALVGGRKRWPRGGGGLKCLAVAIAAPGAPRCRVRYSAREDEPDLGEGESALRAMMWSKAAGPDGVGVQMLRGGAMCFDLVGGGFWVSLAVGAGAGGVEDGA